MEHQNSDIGMAAEMAEKANGEPVIRLDNDSGNNIFTARLSLKSIEQPVSSDVFSACIGKLSHCSAGFVVGINLTSFLLVFFTFHLMGFIY